MDQSRINSLGTGNSSGAMNSARQNGNGITRNTAHNNQNASPIQSASGQYGVAKGATNLRLGEVIRGEISDLSGNEITITLEDNTMVRANIANNSMLSIGQTAAFRLDHVASGGVVLEPVGNYSENELTIINKALEEANLPISDYNQSAVKALIDNVMPINRSSIQQLMQQAYEMKTGDMNSLALMNKLMLPITEDSVHQFSNYRHGTDMLSSQIENYANNISGLLQTLAEHGSAENVAKFGEALLRITAGNSTNIPSSPTTAVLSTENLQELLSLLSEADLSEETISDITNGTLPLKDALFLLKDALANHNVALPESLSEEAITDKLVQIEQILEPASGQTPDDIKNSFTNILSFSGEEPSEIAENAEEITSNETISNSQSLAGKLFHSLQDTVNQSLSDTLKLLQRNPENATSNVPEGLNSLLEQIEDQVSTHQNQYDLTGAFLSPEARGELANLLRSFPVSSSLVDKILTGQASTSEVIQVIRNVIPISDPAMLKELFQTQSFEQLFARFLNTSWSISPEKLMQKDQPDQFYNQLANQMNQLENLIGSSLGGSDSGQYQEAARDIQSNIALMKELSETFTYMQLPLKLPSQQSNGELYVYTQKEARKMNPNNLNVLLQLDLDHLGTVEIRINKNNNDISANFALLDDNSINLFRTNSSMLRDNLNDLGYNTNIMISKQEETNSRMDEFLNTKVKTHATEEMKRFSFDIRA